MPYTDIGETWQKLSLISGHARTIPRLEKKADESANAEKKVMSQSKEYHEKFV